MANRKISYNALRAHVNAIKAMLDESDATYTAATGGADGDPEEMDQPAAQDSASRRRKVNATMDAVGGTEAYMRLQNGLNRKGDL